MDKKWLDNNLKDSEIILKQLKIIREENKIKEYKTLLDSYDLKLSSFDRLISKKIDFNIFLLIKNILHNIGQESEQVYLWANKYIYNMEDTRNYRELSILYDKIEKRKDRLNSLYNNLILHNSSFENDILLKNDPQIVLKKYKEYFKQSIELGQFLNNRYNRGLGKSQFILEYAREHNYKILTNNHKLYSYLKNDNMYITINKNTDKLRGTPKNQKYLVDGINYKDLLELQNMEFNIIGGFVNYN